MSGLLLMARLRGTMSSNFLECAMSLEGQGRKIGRAPSRNVFGTPLESCSTKPVTGFFRNCCCDTGPEDVGVHTVCIVATSAFLAFSKEVGNDLSTPRPEFQFPGVKPGDCWCLCAQRWQEALVKDAAPQVILEATHEFSLEFVSLEDLKAHAAQEPYPLPEE